jgi:CubicO group peptidase (beta-lactamase class C family)
MTAAALAILADEGRLAWDDPVTKHMPAFQMFDPYVTREMTVRDLLVHRSGLGLGAGDLMFFPSSDLSREEIVKRLRFVKPATSFRSRYAYDNILYLVAGQLIPAITGKTWDDFLRERIHLPLGMTATRTGVGLLKPRDEVASPHAKADGKLQPVSMTNLDNNGPAGSVQSSVNDMSRWVMALLNRGELDGKRIFSERQSREMWSPQTITPIGEPRHPALAAVRPMFTANGLGWMLADYRGRRMVWHTGGLSGMVTRVTMIPDLNLGVIVLTNQESGGAFNAITYAVLDHYLGAAAVDWPQVFLESAKKQVADAEATVSKQQAGRKAESRPSLPLAAYAGRYRDAWYGDVVIEQQAKDCASASPIPATRWHAPSLAVRHLHRPLGRPFAVGRCLRYVLAQARRRHRPGEDGRDLSPDRFQFRLPRPAAEARRKGRATLRLICPRPGVSRRRSRPKARGRRCAPSDRSPRGRRARREPPSSRNRAPGRA